MIRIRVEQVLNDDYTRTPHLTLQSSKRGMRNINLPLATDYGNAVESAKYLARMIGPSTIKVEGDYLEVDVHR